MTPEQIAEAHPLVLCLEALTSERNAASLMSNAPAPGGATGGYISIKGGPGGGFSVHYLQDDEFDRIKSTVVSILDRRIDAVTSCLKTLGVEI